MPESRLRIKFGEHEFEANGPAESVQAQFVMFRQLVTGQTEEKTASVAASTDATPPLNKMMLVRGKVLYIKFPVRPADAVLVIIYAQKHFRKNENVSGNEIMDGLRYSGITLRRGDSIMRKHIEEGSVISTGSGRSRRYKLTDAGIQRSQEIIRELSPMVK